LLISSAQGQDINDTNRQLNNFVNSVQILDFDKSIDFSGHSLSTTQLLLVSLNELLETNGDMKNSKINLVRLPVNSKKVDVALAELINAYVYLWDKNDRVSSFREYKKSYVSFLSLDNRPFIKFSILSILRFYREGTLQNDDEFKTYLNAYATRCESYADYFWLNSLSFNLIAQTEIYNENDFENYEVFETLMNKQDSIAKNNFTPGNPLFVYYHLDKANFLVKRKPRSAIRHYNLGLESVPHRIYYTPLKYSLRTNLSRAYARDSKFQLALKELRNSIPYRSSRDELKSKVAFNAYSADYLAGLGKFDSAYFNAKKARLLTYKFKFQEHNTRVAELNVELKTADKEKQILIEQEEKIRNRNIAYGLGGGVVAVSLIGFLLFTNSRRKQRIAEQQSEIEIQKTEKILKEQELTTIDAMIEGQEKERQRLASDLHDSVGATLAAAKLQFDHLAKNKEKLSNMDEIFDKTGKLLDDAYTEVRSMAHVKNSGVIAKNGLLPAVQKLARNASGTNQLKIEVEDFGLNERIENSLEIAVFRMIQELVTNVIKHAQAKEANILITQHVDSLNIIVEDDGVGFNPKQTTPSSDGMGLSSIERRVELLEGSMEVDSSEGKGTTIVIDIPI